MTKVAAQTQTEATVNDTKVVFGFLENIVVMSVSYLGAVLGGILAYAAAGLIFGLFSADLQMAILFPLAVVFLGPIVAVPLSLVLFPAFVFVRYVMGFDKEWQQWQFVLIGAMLTSALTIAWVWLFQMPLELPVTLIMTCFLGASGGVISFRAEQKIVKWEKEKKIDMNATGRGQNE